MLAALNKSGAVEVPVIREVSVLQPSDSDSNSPTPRPTTIEPTEPSTETVLVPDVVGLSQEEAENKLVEANLEASVEPVATALCEHESGEVERTLPPVGTEVSETVVLYVCE
jgi:beta-lactam-binding protein with PASTA domain